MVFGLFSRKADPKPTSPPAQQQLRTPSPSVVSGSSPRANDHPPITPSPTPEYVTDPAALRALIQSIPAKVLQSYTLSHLATASPQLLPHLSQFFSALQPPPLLHCVRCHKGFFDVENNDRSCLVSHDDESAEVERVGSGHETLWGCCGKTVEGEGELPEGWCYEGMHTTDLKRARFRADSTVHEDKLTSCARLRCHDAPGSRKRTRRAAAENGPDTESDSDNDGASHSSVRTRSKRARTTRSEAAPSHYSEDTDVDMADVGPSSPKSSASVRKPKSRAQPKPRARSVVSSASARGAPISASAKPKSRAVKPRSSALPLSSDPPSSPGKKPLSTRFVDATASFTSTTSSAVSVNGSARTQSQSQTQTQKVEVVVTSSSSVKAAKTPAKRTMKPKQTKRLNEVVESSIAGET